MADRQQQQQIGTTTAAKTGGAQGALPKGVVALNHRMATSHGHPSVASVVQVVNAYPHDRDAIMEVLHHQLGNGFVQQVLDGVQRAHLARGSNANMPAVGDPDAAAAPAPPPAAPAPAVAPTPAPLSTATATPAVVPSAPATSVTPAEPAELEQHGWWHEVKQTTADAATLIAEANALTTFHPIKGTFEGNVDLAAALRLAQLVVPASKLPAITLGATPRGANTVYLQVNLYHRTAMLTAAQLQLSGFANASLRTGNCVLQGLQAHASKAGVDAEFAHAHFENVTFIRGGEHVGAADMEVTDLRANDAGGATAMSFGNAHVHGLAYPNVPPVDFDIPGGASFDAVFAHAGAAPAKTTTPGALPAVPDVLPHGSRIAIKLVGAHGAGSTAGTGTAGFEQLHAAIVQDGKELASVEIDGFKAAGAVPGDQANASIRQLAITGDPKLVDTLLQNPQVAGNPSVKAAIDLVRSVGLDPSIGGHIVAHNITANHAAAGDQAKGDFDGSFDIPQLGQLAVQVTGMSASTTGGTAQIATQFDKCSLTLRDHDQKELAFLELDGGAAKIAGAQRSGQVKQIAARGNVAKLVTAGDAIVKHAPVDVRGALQAVRALGFSGTVTGSLAVDTDGKTTTFSGDFDASVDAGPTGAVAIHVAGLHGSDGGDVSFGAFTASLKDAKSKQVATIDVEGGETKAKGETSAKKISANGEDASVNAMIAAIQAKATALPAPVKAAFAMVRRFYANAGGSITMTDATVGTTKAGADTATASTVNASFELHGAGTAQVALTGFHTVLGKTSDSVAFTTFDATLIDTAGHKAAHVKIEGSNDSFATAGKHDDFSLSAKSIHVDGNSKQASALFAGVRAHLSTLPPPIAASFRLIEKYTGEVAANGSISATDVAIASKGGQLTGHGNLEGTVRVPEGTIDAKLAGAKSDGEHLGFDALDVSVKSARGGVAASLHATGAKSDVHAKSTTLSGVQVHGDAAQLRAVLDPAIQKLMPAQIGRALAMLDDSSLSMAANGVAITQGAAGTRAEARTITATGTIEVSDVAGKTYTCRGAQLELDGAEVVMDAAGKPRELSVTAMAIHGNWTAVGGGDALSGDATVRTGAARIQLDANGAPIGVRVANVAASGDATRHATGAAPATSKATPSRAQQLASLDSETETAEAVAQSVRSADIRATVPLFAGRYGSGLEHVNVPAGATISIAVEVRNNTLTNETSVHIAPPLDIPAGSIKGIDLETKGRQGILDAQVSGFSGFLAGLFGKTDVNALAVGNGPLSLDLPTLVRQVTDHMRQGILSAESKAPDPRAAQKDAQWLASERASWQNDHAKHLRQGASQRTLDKDAAEQPRSANVADLATKGVDLGRSSASADIVLARVRDGGVTGHLHGSANGAGRMQLTADALSANVAGNAVNARGVDTGTVNVATTGDSTSVRLAGLKIDSLDWSRK